jgi:dTDP-4-amino-4,6-dideoxygalactose transaminase
VHNVVSLSSCTSALFLSLTALGVGPGDEVITTPLSFVATANAILHTGATPVFVDVEPETGNLDVSRIERAITNRTRVVIPVHLYGLMVDMRALSHLCRRRGIIIIEDAAHAAEAERDGVRPGQLGQAACFSFYATKNLTTAEGGMLTADQEFLDRARLVSLHGMSRDAWKRYDKEGSWFYEVVLPGFKYNMTDLQASLGIHQLARIEHAHRRRSEIWARYNEAFCDLDGIRIPPVALESVGAGRHARHLYTLWLDWDELGLSRGELVDALAADGIGVGWHFSAVHLQRYYRERYGYEPGSLPVAERIANQTLSLPLSAAITNEQVERVIASVAATVRAAA